MELNERYGVNTFQEGDVVLVGRDPQPENLTLKTFKLETAALDVANIQFGVKLVTVKIDGKDKRYLAIVDGDATRSNPDSVPGSKNGTTVLTEGIAEGIQEHRFEAFHDLGRLRSM